MGEGTKSDEGIEDDNENNMRRGEDMKETEPYVVPIVRAMILADIGIADILCAQIVH